LLDPLLHLISFLLAGLVLSVAAHVAKEDVVCHRPDYDRRMEEARREEERKGRVDYNVDKVTGKEHGSDAFRGVLL